MRRITADESQAIMATLATNVRWAEIDFDESGLRDCVLSNATEAGSQFESFLLNGCRMVVDDPYRETGDLSIAIPALPRPKLANFSKSWEIKAIERDTSPEGPVTLTLATVFALGEGTISPRVYERRLAARRDRVLGLQHLRWLFRHQRAFSALSGLRIPYAHMLFPGIVLLTEYGQRVVPSLMPLRKGWTYDPWVDFHDVSLTREDVFAVDSSQAGPPLSQ